MGQWTGADDTSRRGAIAMPKVTALSKLAALIHVDQEVIRLAILQVIEDAGNQQAEENERIHMDAMESCYDTYGSDD